MVKVNCPAGKKKGLPPPTASLFKGCLTALLGARCHRPSLLLPRATSKVHVCIRDDRLQSKPGRPFVYEAIRTSSAFGCMKAPLNDAERYTSPPHSSLVHYCRVRVHVCVCCTRTFQWTFISHPRYQSRSVLGCLWLLRTCRRLGVCWGAGWG